MTIKNELTSVSNWIGVAIGTIGNLLPYLTPDALTALGFTAPWVHGISTAATILLLAYRETPKAADPSIPPFVKPPEKLP